MNGFNAAAPAGARPGPADDRSLLEGLLGSTAAPPAPAWAAPARLRPAGAICRSAPAWPVARRVPGRPLAAAATLLLAGGIVAASVGVGPARAASAPVAAGVEVAALPRALAPAAAVGMPGAAAPTAQAPAFVQAPATGALRALAIAPARDEALLTRLLAAPATARQDAALLAELLASEPPAAVASAPPAAVSFATVARLPAAALSYSAAVQQLPMITLAHNAPPPPPRPVVAQAQQPPAPAGYVAPPGYRDGLYLGGQYPGLAPGQFPAVVGRPSTRPGARPSAVASVYVVRHGDTLSGIALRFYGDARYAALIWDYNYRTIGANPNRILPGQRLSLPGVGQVARPAAPLPARGPIAQRAYYTIQPQDFLRWMSQRAYGNEVHWPEIYHANRNVLGPNPDLIYPGVRVYIP